jgi:HK97 family phage major capsid protein
MSEAVGSEGGYMVMPEFAGGIIDRVYNNNLWGLTDNYTVVGNNLTFLANAETNRATGSRHGGLRGYWLSGEGATITKSKPSFREVTLKLAKLGVVVYLTQELLDDGGSALQQYVARKAAEEFNFMIGDSLINGTGVGQPLGILNSPSLVSVAKENGQLAATLQTENVEKMYARFYAPNINGLVWYHNQDILPQLNTMTLGIGAAGVPTYLPPGGVSVAPYGTLMGRPLQPIEFASTLGTQGDLIAADLGQVLSISKGGVAQAVSIHLEFLTDQMAVRFIMRLNAGPWENAPLTPYKGTGNTQSSFVVLDTRA